MGELRIISAGGEELLDARISVANQLTV